MTVLHNCMTPGDGALTIQFLDASLGTSVSLSTFGLKQAVAFLLDFLLPEEG